MKAVHGGGWRDAVPGAAVDLVDPFRDRGLAAASTQVGADLRGRDAGAIDITVTYSSRWSAVGIKFSYEGQPQQIDQDSMCAALAHVLRPCDHPHMLMLDDDLGHLSYDIAGDGSPIVLVHAGIADHRMWDAVVPALAERHTVIRYDLRGFGESALPSGPFRETDDLRRLLDHLGHERVRLVGASWGGRVALDFTLTHPDRVHSLAMLAAPWPRYHWSADMIAYDEAETAALEAGDVDAAVRINLDMWLRGPARSWDDVADGLTDQLRGPLRTSLVNQSIVGQHSQGPATGDLAAVSVPTLVGVGKLDVSDFQDIARRYAAEIPGATLVEFSTAAHLIAMDAPAELSAVLSSFLAR